MLSTLALWVLTSYCLHVNALLPIVAKGVHFFTTDGNQFFIKGIAYQLIPDDPLVDGAQCARDAALMKELGANTIRVYHVDSTKDHTACMNTFEDAGIYAFIDLDTFSTEINQSAPQWNQTQFDKFAAVMDAFQGYNNTAGFFVGNEVLTTPAGSIAAPYVKAAASDMKYYRFTKGYRNIPIGYSAADISSLRPMLQNYLACGTYASDAIDFFSLNAYEWCGPNTFAQSGYQALNDAVKSYNIPIFFSETGCNVVRPRDFQDQSAIFSSDMSPYWSGAIIYEWIQEQNQYGLIEYGPKVDPKIEGSPPDGFPRSGTPTPINPDFTNLQSQWAQVKPNSTAMSVYNPTPMSVSCPQSTSGTWDVDGNASLPVLIRNRTGSPPGATPYPSSSSSTRTRAISTPTDVSGVENRAPSSSLIMTFSFMSVFFGGLIIGIFMILL